MSGHSPGPWVAYESCDRDAPWSITTRPNPLEVVAVGVLMPANARLIAAAPDLLEALVEIEERTHPNGDMPNQAEVEVIYGLARDAIALARRNA